MGLFDKAESRVERHTSGLNKNVRFNEYGKKIFNIPENENHESVEEGLISKIIQGPETVKEELSESEKRYREMNMQKVIRENTNKNFLQSLGNKTKLCVLENVLSSIYYDALYLDDDFKEYNRNVINESVHNFLDERGGYKYIEDAYQKNKSPLLKEIMRICEETSTEINKRKINESKNAEELGENVFNFNMLPEEEKKLDYSKEQIGLKQISNVVKEKVLNVVKEEKKRESEHEELLSEIENELSDNPDIKNPEAVAEALNKIFVDNVNIEEGTLFNALLRNGLKSVIESGYESLDLIKEESEEDVSDELNKLSLENIIAEAETHEYNDEEIYNDKMQELFDNFVEKIEEGRDFGKTDDESILYAFETIEPKMDEITDNSLDFNELLDIRRDFRLLQDVIESALDNGIKENINIEESKENSDTILEDLEFINEETDDKLFDIEEGCSKKKKCKESCDDDEDDDDDDDYDDDKKCKKSKCKENCTTKEGKCGTKEGCGTSKCKEGCSTKKCKENCTTKEGKCGTKEGCGTSKCKEGCSTKKCKESKCSVKEYYENILAVEEGKCGTKEGCGTSKCKEGKCGTKEGCGTSKCKEGKCGTKEGCGTSKCKEGCSTKKCKENCNNKDCNTKTIDTTFEQSEYDYIDNMDYNDLFEVDSEIVGEAGMRPGFALRNIGTIYGNTFKSSVANDIRKIEPGLLKMVSRCKKMQDIEFLSRDAYRGITQLKIMKAGTDDKAKKVQIDEHIKWLQTTYRDAIKAKKKELKNKQKAVKEAAVYVLEDYISEIDKKLDMHTSAQEFANNEVYITENYERFVIPIINKSDSSLDGLKLPYKMKAVLETLLNTMEKFDKYDNIKAVKKAISTNKENVTAILESYKGIPSVPLYKVNYFNTFNDLINILDKKADEILETYNDIEIDDYIYENSIGMYDDEDTFRIITESVCDDFNPDEVNTIDMDYILADTIAKYTLMETMYTMNLEQYTYDSIKKMTTNMLNKK